MGAPKGKKHRVFTAEQKEEIVERYFKSHKSHSQFAEEEGIHSSCIRRWISQYEKNGIEGLASHRGQCGNPYAALHTSKNLDEIDELRLRIAKLEMDVARLKKGFQVKGSGCQKEYVTSSGKSFKSLKS